MGHNKETVMDDYLDEARKRKLITDYPDDGVEYVMKCSRCGCEGKEQTLRLEIEALKETVRLEVEAKKALEKQVRRMMNEVLKSKR